jgi:hypothetical protein
MTSYVVQHETSVEHRSFRLSRPAPRTTTQTGPDLVLPADRVRDLLAAARAQDVSRGGCLSAGPAGVQLWSGPWDAPDGRAGSALHLGSVDWSWDTPVHHYVTVYRVLLTAEGARRGLTPEAVLDSVLGSVLGSAVRASQRGVPAPAVAARVPLPRDPFRAETWDALTGDQQQQPARGR